MSSMQGGAGALLPAQDRALGALADVLEDLGDETSILHRTADEPALGACRAQAEAVTRAIVALPSATLHGASAKARAAKASTVPGLLPVALVNDLGFNMAADVVRLRNEEIGHA